MPDQITGEKGRPADIGGAPADHDAPAAVIARIGDLALPWPMT